MTVKRTPEDVIANALENVFIAEPQRQRWARYIVGKLEEDGFQVTNEKTFTREEVETAWNAGAELVLQDSGLELSDRDTDLVNLVCNAIGTCLDNPGTEDLDTVIRSNYDPETDLMEDEEENAKLSEEDIIAASIATVKGWINS